MLHLEFIPATNAGNRMALDVENVEGRNVEIHKVVVRTSSAH